MILHQDSKNFKFIRLLFLITGVFLVIGLLSIIGVFIFNYPSRPQKLDEADFFMEFGPYMGRRSESPLKGLFIKMDQAESISGTLAVSATVENTTDIPILLAADENGKCIAIVEVTLNSGKIKRNMDSVKLPVNSIVLKENSSMTVEGSLKISPQEANTAKGVRMKLLDVVEASEILHND